MNDFLPIPPKSSAANLQSGPGSLLKDNSIPIKQAPDKASKTKKDKVSVYFYLVTKMNYLFRIITFCYKFRVQVEKK